MRLGPRVAPVPVQPGETVLIVGTGSVALFAAQFARMHGARVICISDPFGGRYLAIRRIAVGSRADFEA